LDFRVAVFLLYGDVCEGDACGFEAEADELAAAWDAGVVKEFILRVSASFLCGGHGSLSGEVEWSWFEVLLWWLVVR
jgi:hypothetical protein